MQHVVDFVGPPSPSLTATIVRSACPPTTGRQARLQCRLNRFLTCPETISVKDNLVSGTVVAELPLAAAKVLANGGWLAATLGPSRLITFRRFFSTSTTVGGGGGGGGADAYDCSGDGSLIAGATSVGGGTMVDWLVSMTTRSGGLLNRSYPNDRPVDWLTSWFGQRCGQEPICRKQ